MYRLHDTTRNNLTHRLNRLVMCLTVLFFVALSGLQHTSAQNFLVVEPDNFPADVGALNEAIEGDIGPDGQPEHDGYMLRRDGTYWLDATIINEGWHLHIVAEEGDGHPPIIRPAVDLVGDSRRHFEPEGDITLEGVYLSAIDDQGGSIGNIVRGNVDDMRIVLNNVYSEFDRSAFIRTNGRMNSIYATNVVSRNNGRNQFSGNGRFIDTRANLVDTIVVENCTFYNVEWAAVRSEGGRINYMRFNHNTIVDVGANYQLHSVVELHFTNNLLINNGWHTGLGGISTTWVPGQEVLHPNSGLFGIRSMADFDDINDEDRTIVFANNNFNVPWDQHDFGYARELMGPYRDEIEAIFEASHDTVLIQYPLFDSTATALMEQGIIQFEDNFWESEEDLQINDRPDFDKLVAALNHGVFNPDDPGGLPPYQDNMLTGPDYETSLDMWRDFGYATSAYSYGAAENGYPVGDLNWFPELKEKWLAGEVITSAGPEERIAHQFKLVGNYPNPFNPNTTIVYEMNERADVTMEVFNVVGQKVAGMDLGNKTPGRHHVNFDAEHLASGMYLVRMQAGTNVQTLRMTLIK